MIRLLLTMALCFLFFIICGLTSATVIAQTKVVVVPLLGSDNEVNFVDQFVNVETSYTWNCPPDPESYALSVECPVNCIAVGGACSSKTGGEVSGVAVTGENFIKTSAGLSKYNAYVCYMQVQSCRDPEDSPIGYAQVVCYCNN